MNDDTDPGPGPGPDPDAADIFDRFPQLRGRPAAAAMVCTLLAQRGDAADAYALGVAAVAAAPDDMAIRHEVNLALSRGVQRFQYPMLRDDARNRAYIAAIERVVRPGMRVLEIGSGAGLLTLAAARAGGDVTACEAKPAIAAAAAAVIAHNGASDRVRLIPRHSGTLRIPEDLPGPADVVIHEIFGHTLFNEGVTAAMTDARARLMQADTIVIPPRAAIRCMPVGFANVPERHDLSNVEGFDLSPFVLALHRKLPEIPDELAPRALAPPQSALAMDYTGAAPFGPAHETLWFTSTGGRVDAIMTWLQLDFGDGAMLDNDPASPVRANSWKPATFALPSSVETAPGDRIEVRLRHRATTLLVDATVHR